MKTFVAVDDSLLAERIGTASGRIIFVAPAVSKTVAAALCAYFDRVDRVSITIILDPDDEEIRDLQASQHQVIDQLKALQEAVAALNASSAHQQASAPSTPPPAPTTQKRGAR